MRPGLVRAFSTTRRIAQQQLFVPYEPPLNERQKKAIRKKARADEPNYHVRFNADAQWAIEAYSRAGGQKVLLDTTLKQIRGIVRKHAGPEYDVEDISVHTYSRHINDAPFEFAIVDKSRPDGLSPEENQTKLPVVYDASRFSEVLMQEGFTGGFWAPPWDCGKGEKKNSALIPPERDLMVPWPNYQRPALRELLYPVRMITYSPVAFSLTLPGPGVLRSHRLIQHYFELQPSMGLLMALLFTWTRSHRMDEFTTQCLAFMIIRYFQEVGKVPNLLNPEDPKFKATMERRKERFWVPFQYQLPLADSGPSEPDLERERECRIEPALLDYTLTDYKVSSKYLKKPGSLFWDFITFWRIAETIGKTFALSVGQNKYLKRQHPPLKDRQRDNVNPRIFHRMEKTTSWVHQFDYNSPTYNPAMHPLTWPWQALVVQDPFIPTYNHAESVSRETLHSFSLMAQQTSRKLSHDWPFISVFGQYFIPPKAKAADIFMHKRNFDPTMRRYHVKAVHAKPAGGPKITEPPEPILAARRRTVARVCNVIRRKFGPKYIVHAFGSTEYGVSSAKSDLDLVVIDPDRMCGFPPGTKCTDLPDIYDIKRLARALWSAGFTNVTPLPTANVPIVKFTDKINGLDCDINVNEQLGRFNTGMIKRYCDLVPILRPMVAFIKRWAKPIGLNSPGIRHGSPTFSSYALMLMTISFLQSRGLAPNLQDGLEHEPDINANWVTFPQQKMGFFWLRRKTRDGDVRIMCDTRYHLGRGWVAEKTMDYKSALVAWFQYWGNEHPYSTSVGNIRQGGFVLKQPDPPSTRMSLDAVNENQVEGQTLVPSTKLSVLHAEHMLVTDRAEVHVAQEQEHYSRSLPAADTPDAELNNKSPVKLPNMTLGTTESPTLQQPPKWLDHPLCIVDPFIRSRVVTQNISRKSVQLFQQNCKRTATMLSWGASLDDVASKSHSKRKIPKASPAGSEPDVSIISAPLDNTDADLEASWVTLAALKEYPGAYMLGPKLDTRLASRASELVIDVDDPFELKDSALPTLLSDPESPKDEQEGFGLKRKYFDSESPSEKHTSSIALLKSLLKMADPDLPDLSAKESSELDKSDEGCVTSNAKTDP